MGELRGTDPRLTGALLGLGVLLAAVLLAVGLEGLVLVAGLLGALVLLARPGWAVALLVGAVVVAEARGPGVLLDGSGLYEETAGLTPLDGLLALAAGAVIVELWRRNASMGSWVERAPFPLLLLGALGLFALAAVSGVLMGRFAGVPAGEVADAARPLAYLVVVPLLVLGLLRTERDVRVALGVAAALAVLKAAAGLLGWATEEGPVVAGDAVTFFEPAANALVLLVLLVVAAALLQRVRLPAWVLLGAPLLALALALAQRHAFWVGAVLGLLLVVLLGSTPLARRVLAPAAALVAVALWAISAVGFQPQAAVEGPAQTGDRAQAQREPEARYVVDERANVLAELRRQPFTGLGLGVPWTAREPLGIELPGGRQYVHAAALWHWLKLGILGLAAYVALLLVAGRLAWLAWRGSAGALSRAAGLGALCWIVAMAVVETRAAFTGVDLRHTALLGALLGVLAALPRASAAR